MSKFIVAVFLFFSVFSTSFSQANLSDFSYVIVPDQFEFLNGKDKYELNSMTVFYLEKYGFNAYKNSEAPNANRCDGLYADVIKESAVLRTKLRVVIKDCNGFELFSGGEGTSKIKEFKSAYQDALRKAFKGVEFLNVQQKEVVLYNTEEADNNPVAVEKTSEVSPAETKTSDKKEVRNTPAETAEESLLPTATFSNYTFQGKSYLLRKTTEGYSLYEETTTTKDGLLLLGTIQGEASEKLYFVTAEDALYKASFDASGNLSIQKKNTSEVYKKSN